MNKKDISLPVFADERGCLGVIEFSKLIPFDVRRIYYMSEMDTEVTRGCHAHKRLKQFIVCLSGSFELLLDDGENRTTTILNNPSKGIYVDKMIWRELSNFSTGTVILVLANEEFDETEYIRDYKSFICAVNNQE